MSQRPYMILSRFLALMTIFSTGAALHAQDYAFTEYVGPFSEGVTPFCTTSDGLISIGSGVSGVFRSSDDGRTWRVHNTGLPNRNVMSLAADPAGDRLLATLKDGTIAALRTGDTTWQLLGMTRFPLPNLAVSRLGTIYVHDTTYGIDRSRDGGATWTRVFVPGDHGLPDIQSVAAYDSEVVVGTKYGGVFQSPDEGASWSRTWTRGIDAGLTYFTRGGICIVSNYADMLRSSDRGATWQQIPLKKPNENIRAIAEDRNGTLWWSTQHDGFYSHDTGRTWTVFGYLAIMQRMHVSDAGTILYTKHRRGILRSEDTTRTTTVVSPDFTRQPVLGVCVSKRGTVFLAVGYNTYRSTDEGVSWRRIPFKDRLEERCTLAADTVGNVYSLMMGNDLQMTSDEGETWAPFVPDSIRLRGIRHVYFRADGNLFISLQDSTYGFTTDRGKSWSTIRCPDAAGPSIAATNLRFIINGTSRYCFWTKDAGLSFEQSSLPKWDGTVFFHSPRSRTLYAAMSTSIYRSDDSGTTWQTIFTDGTSNPRAIIELRNGDVIIGGAMFDQSLDNGATWKKLRLRSSVDVNQLSEVPSGDVWAATTNNCLLIAKPRGEVTRLVEAPSSPPSGVSITPPWPNPILGTSSFGIRVHADGSVRCAVYSLLGEEVRTLMDASAGAGTTVLTWDGRDAAGARVPPGVYLLRVQSASGAAGRTVVVLGE